MAHVVHSCVAAVWRRLPVNARRSAFHRTVDALAPRLCEASALIKLDPGLPKIIVGFLSSATGLGQSARLAAAAFREQGFSVLGIDVSSFFVEYPSFASCDLPTGRGHRGPAHVVVVVNAPYMKYVLCLLGQRFLVNKFVTGYWAWEQPIVPEEWERGFDAVHDVVAPSRFAATAITARGPMLKVGVASHPVGLQSPPLLARAGRKKQSPFTIVSMMNVGSGFARKNPLGLIRAFRLAFGNSKQARLKLIVTGTNNYPLGRALILDAARDCANIVIQWNLLERSSFYRWWDDADAFALLHRAEGFGLPIAEAMSAGYPVVATGWSGNMDYMTEKNSFPLRYRLIEVEDPQDVYCRTEGMWADPDCEHAAELFLRLNNNPTLAARIGEAARMSALEKFSAPQFVHPMIYS